jgi:CO dehydrogenase maturation factor
MRVAFHGKGGAGKTTTAAGFVKYAASTNPFVLAFDADLNAHLKAALCIDGEPEQLGMHFDEITTYLKGTRQDIGDRPIIGNIPPAAGSNFIRVAVDDLFINKHALKDGNIALLTVGAYELKDVASTCYHEKLKSMIGIFHHLLDDENDVVIADSIAGTDNIATSLSFAYDMNVFVVEPTSKSIGVYKDYVDLVPQYADRLYVIGNKVADEPDLEFIKQHVPETSYLGSIPFSENLKRFEQGKSCALQKFHSEQEPVFEKTYNILKSKKRDWGEYLDRLRVTYRWDCDRWYSEFYKCDLVKGIDETFTYESVLRKYGTQEKLAHTARV